MIKVIRLVRKMHLTEIRMLEDDGIDAFERIKQEMGVNMILELSKELFDKLFKVRIIDPRDEKLLDSLKKQYEERPTSYNKAMIDYFKQLKNSDAVEIEIILEI